MPWRAFAMIRCGRAVRDALHPPPRGSTLAGPVPALNQRVRYRLG
jgi:hypothetical protein